MAVAKPSILRIERCNYAIGAVVALVGLITQPSRIALGLAAGFRSVLRAVRRADRAAEAEARRG